MVISGAHPGWAVLLRRTHGTAEHSRAEQRCDSHSGAVPSRYAMLQPTLGTSSASSSMGISTDAPLSGAHMPLEREQHGWKHCPNFPVSFSHLCQLYFCPGNTPAMHSFSWWARIKRTLYKACLIKWLLSTKNLVLPIKYSQVRVLILLTLCLRYALEEAAWPFCLIQAHFANTNKMLCLAEH